MTSRSRSPQPYSMVPPPSTASAALSAATASATAAERQAAAVREALAARVAAAAAASIDSSSAAAAATTAGGGPGADPGAGGAPPNPAAPSPAAEDAVQDGGDAIDTFSSYVPTALPPCVVQVLRERATQEGEADASVGATSSSSSNNKNSSSSNSRSEMEVVDLLDDVDDSNLVPSASLPTAKGMSTTGMGNDKNDDVIELLDTDNEDSRMAVDGIVNDGKIASASTSSKTDPPSESDALPSSLWNGAIPSHTSPAVESALLSSVTAPSVPDESAETVLDLVRTGQLSPLQAEGVTLAINRFRRVFTSKGAGKNDAATRAGFFLGDGAGIGKGRQISATIRDALCRNQGRGRHLWISVSRELVQDARRDLADVGCHVDVHDGADVLDQMGNGSGGGKKSKGLGAGGSLGKGVLFITYSLLVSGKRVEDIIGWLAGGVDPSPPSGDTKRKPSTGNATSRAVEKAQQVALLKEKRTRIESSYDGLIIFDEAHKAKNLESDTRTAKLVLAIQERLPKARILYCSATGVSDIKHMAYGTRLGLWGAANPLYPTFDSFKTALSKRGVGALEMLALEMKRKGLFMARTLSWDGAEFNTVEVTLTKQQTISYDSSARWWLDVKEEIMAALNIMDIAPPKTLWRSYWSSHQRFFREMCICAKIDEVAKQAKVLLDNNHAIVIGLQSTGEAGMEVALEELADSLLASDNARALRRSDSGKIDFEDVALPSLVSTCASVMTNFVRNHFPTTLPPPEVPKVPDVPPNGFSSEFERAEHMRLTELAERIRNMPDPEPIPELVARRSRILESIRDLDLPPNPLDDIIDRLGGADNVAEMTGRSGRILRDEKSGMYHYVKRYGGPTKQKQSFGLSMPVNREDENDRLNIVEKRKFMEGKKSVAIISDAASTGISLHTDKRCNSSYKRRVHFTIELPWAADKAIQQLGRSHRSGQCSAPIYKMVVTELGGERRFAAAVSKRMAQLGALTKGDRRAATGTDLSDFDIDSIFGRRALNRTYIALREQPYSAPSRNSNDVLDSFVALEEIAPQLQGEDETGRRSAALRAASDALTEVGLTAEPNVKQFLNRIAGLDVARQNLIFSLFMSTLDDVITDAKATGEFEGSVEDIRASQITLNGQPEVIATDASCGAKTELTRLIVDRGISFDDIVQTIFDGEEEDSDSDKAKTSGDEQDAMSNDEEEEDIDDDPYAPAESGFYLSRRKIAGRHLIMYAQRKVAEENDVDSDFIDPLGLMIVSRPNTGKNPCEMASQNLRHKYRLLVSSSDLLKYVASDNEEEEESDSDDEEKKSEKDTVGSKDIFSKVRTKYRNVCKLWDEAYKTSNCVDHNDGLAPRISEVGLITGAVLHVLPALEKAVLFLRSSQRSLRVMRVELSDSGQRIVGIRFPVTDDAIGKLMTVMKELSSARQGSLDTPSFVDEPFAPIDDKAMSWATTERKTMKSFFGAATSKPPAFARIGSSNTDSSSKPGKRKESTFVSPLSQTNTKKKQKSSKTSTKNKKAPTKHANISSFFGKKN